jgi:hypothetical protein
MTVSLDIGARVAALGLDPRIVGLGLDPRLVGFGLGGSSEDTMTALQEFIQNPYRIYTFDKAAGFEVAGQPPQSAPSGPIWILRAWRYGLGGASHYAALPPFVLNDTGRGEEEVGGVPTGVAVEVGKLFSEDYNILRPNPPEGMASATGAQMWRFRKVLGAWMSMTNRTFAGAKPSPTQFVGIGQGYPTWQIDLVTQSFAMPPWPDPPEADFVQLRIRGDLMRWELVAGRTGVATTIVPLVGVEAPVQAILQFAHFVWDPAGGPNGGPLLEGWVNGVKGAEITDPALLPGGGEDAWGQCVFYNNHFSFSGDPTAEFPGSFGYVTGRHGPIFCQEFDVLGAS